jgi:hypothetical protein
MKKLRKKKNVIDKKTGSLIRVFGVIELVVARWGRPMLVVVIPQAEILGGGEYLFGMKIGGNEKCMIFFFRE